MAAGPPAWVIGKLRELVRDGLTGPLCAQQISALGFQCSVRQIKLWMSKHGIRRFSRLSNGELDAIIQRVRANGGAGEREGHRWIHSAINAQLAPLRVGRDRVQKALVRLFPEEVAERRRAVEKRLIRRVYVADYYLQSGHLDYNCKCTLPGGIKLYTYGHADGDSRCLAALEVAFVKTAKAAFEDGFLRALEFDGYAISDKIHLDSGGEWAIILYSLDQQGLAYKKVKSIRNVKIERPWGDYNPKVVALVRDAGFRLKSDGLFDEADVHDQYGMRVAAQLALQAGADEFRARYNEHNVAGPRGGVPSVRRKYRTRPAGAAPAATFDSTRDWAAEYAEATGKAYHGETHFVQYYSEVLQGLLGNVQPAAPLPSAVWRDVKMADGRGEFRELYECVRALSRQYATAESILEAEEAERRYRED